MAGPQTGKIAVCACFWSSQTRACARTHMHMQLHTVLHELLKRTSPMHRCPKRWSVSGNRVRSYMNVTVEFTDGHVEQREIPDYHSIRPPRKVCWQCCSSTCKVWSGLMCVAGIYLGGTVAIHIGMVTGAATGPLPKGTATLHRPIDRKS